MVSLTHQRTSAPSNTTVEVLCSLLYISLAVPPTLVSGRCFKIWESSKEISSSILRQWYKYKCAVQDCRYLTTIRWRWAITWTPQREFPSRLFFYNTTHQIPWHWAEVKILQSHWKERLLTLGENYHNW